MSEEEFTAARETVSSELLTAIRDGIDHVRRFNEQLVARGDWSFESEPGLTVGEKVTPIASAGLFVPSGKASYPSVLVQLGTPAVVAGVPDIAVVVPPVPGSAGEVDPAVLVVAEELGIYETSSGPTARPAIAALAFGTETIPKVRKVVGPGSPAVTCAQVEVQRYGTVTTMLLGPSESLVIADDSADPRLLAADLLNEAEHGARLVEPARHRQRGPVGGRPGRGGPPAGRAARTAPRLRRCRPWAPTGAPSWSTTWTRPPK